MSEHLQAFSETGLLNFAVVITDKPVEFTPVEKTLSKKRSVFIDD